MDRVQGNQHRLQKPVHYMLQERSQTNAENASQPLMNDANIENNTANQPSSKKWGPWKIAAAVTAGIIAVGGVAGAVVGALYVTGNLSFGPADTAKDLMSRDVSNTTVLNNGTTPGYTGGTTYENITSYISNKLFEATSTFTNAMYSQSQRFISEAPTPIETTSRGTTESDPCDEEGISGREDYIKKNIGPLNSIEGRKALLIYLKDCLKRKLY